MGKKLGEERGGGAGEGAGRETERRDSAEETGKLLLRDARSGITGGIPGDYGTTKRAVEQP